MLKTFSQQHYWGKLKFSLVIKNKNFQATLTNNERIFCEHILKVIDSDDWIFLRHASFEQESETIFFENDLNRHDISPTKSDILSLSAIENQNILMFPQEPKIFFSFIKMYCFEYMGNKIWTSVMPEIVKEYERIECKVGEIDVTNGEIKYYTEK